MYLGTVWSSTIPATNPEFIKFVPDNKLKESISQSFFVNYADESRTEGMVNLTIKFAKKILILPADKSTV
jgi:hypothetical protein